MAYLISALSIILLLGFALWLLPQLLKSVFSGLFAPITTEDR